MINLFLSQTKSKPSAILWILFAISSCVFSAEEHHKLCSTPFNCSDQVGLLYPFWKSGNEACGHPDFRLECNTTFAEVTLSSVKFRIMKTDYESGIARLARSDYIGGFCPQNPLNASFNEHVLPFAQNTEILTIYYDCSAVSSPIPNYVGEISCEDDEKSYYVTRNLSSPLLSGISGLLNDFRGRCTRQVSIPASGPALDTLQNFPTPENLRTALQAGFQLGPDQDCSMCRDSGVLVDIIRAQVDSSAIV